MTQTGPTGDFPKTFYVITGREKKIITNYSEHGNLEIWAVIFPDLVM